MTLFRVAHAVPVKSDVTNQKLYYVKVQEDPPCRGSPVCGRNVSRAIIVEVMDAVEETTGSSHSPPTACTIWSQLVTTEYTHHSSDSQLPCESIVVQKTAAFENSQLLRRASE